MLISVNSWILTSSPYIWFFKLFPKIGIIGMVISGKSRNIQNEIAKIRKFTLVIIFVIFPQKWQIGLVNESSEISRNSAKAKRVI